MIRVVAWTLCGLAVAALPAAAQTTDTGFRETFSPSIAQTAQTMHATIRRNLADAAAQMPAEEYAFRPTSEIRTFAELVGHVVNANFLFCSQAKGEPSPGKANFEKVSNKTDLVKAMNDALAYCDEVYRATTDGNFTQPVKLTVGGAALDTTRGAILTFNTAHNNEHYGNVVVYMRLKGHVPPSTERAQQTKK